MQMPLLHHLRYALRQLRRSPAFTLTVVLTLALGIGANAAVFTLFDQVLLRMLPVRQPGELVRFVWTGSFSGTTSTFGDTTNFFSYPMYRDLRDRNQVFTGVLAADETHFVENCQSHNNKKKTELVTGNYFSLLGLKPAAGRLFTAQDDTAKNANPVLVLGYDYWQARFAASPSVIGQSVQVNGHPFTILGVAPRNFHSAIGGYKPGVFLPISMVELANPWMVPIDNLHNRQSLWLTLAARLKPGVTRAQAQAALAPLWHTLRAYELTFYQSQSRRFRQNFLDRSRLKVLDDSTGFSPDRIQLKTPLILLMSMASLLVAMCAINVATLLLLRAAGRAREMSMRYALGASRGRIVAQLLLEGCLLGACGAAAGLLLAPPVANLLVRLLSADPANQPYSPAIDQRVLLFTLSVSLLASLLFSIAPVFHFLRPDLTSALRQNAGTASAGSQRFRKLAVGAQIALSVLLLGGAGLFVRTLANLRSQPLGFSTSHIATFYLDPTESGYGDARTASSVRDALDAVRRIPGVASAGATTDPELIGSSSFTGFTVQGHRAAEDEAMSFEDPWITPGYFATLRQPLLTGRDFTAADARQAPKVAIVNLAFALRFYGSAPNALGHSVAQGTGTPDTVIIGVVGNTRHRDLRTALGPAIYRPYAQMPNPGGAQISVRTSQPPQAVEASIRRAIHTLDPSLVLTDLRTMQAQVDISAADERALATLAIGFSALALVLAAVGLYGVLAYSTQQRSREIGVRLALGAQRGSVVLLVVREMLAIAAVATLLALPCVVALAQLFRSQLYGVAASDPLTLLAAVAFTALPVALAAALPAHQAASVQPTQALRTE